jgi:hypothetical protein
MVDGMMMKQNIKAKEAEFYFKQDTKYNTT